MSLLACSKHAWRAQPHPQLQQGRFNDQGLKQPASKACSPINCRARGQCTTVFQPNLPPCCRHHVEAATALIPTCCIKRCNSWTQTSAQPFCKEPMQHKSGCRCDANTAPPVWRPQHTHITTVLPPWVLASVRPMRACCCIERRGVCIPNQPYTLQLQPPSIKPKLAAMWPHTAATHTTMLSHHRRRHTPFRTHHRTYTSHFHIT